MIQQKLLHIIEVHKNKSHTLFVRTLLKEELQNYILNFVYNDTFYKKLIFTGGTCLRKIYGLPRLSEDLDFDFTEQCDIHLFADKVREYFFEKLQYKDIMTKISGRENTVFFKFPILEELGFTKGASDSSVLFVRCDFSKETVGIFKTEINSISTSDFTFYVLSYDLSTLFANKISAFLSRKFFKGSEQQIPFKGRDVFDLSWFMELSAKRGFVLQPYWKRIFKVLDLKNKGEVIEAIQAKMKTIDKKSVYTDLLPFIEDLKSLQNFTDNFLSIMTNKFLQFQDQKV